MYKNLFQEVVALITQPGKAWKSLSEREEKADECLTRFVYPLLGLVTAAAFVGIFFTRKEFSLEIALKSAIKILVASFCGFFLAAYWLSELWVRYFRREKDLKLCQRFVGYASALMFALNIVLAILPESDFFFLRFLMVYTFYIVWEGAVPYMKVEEPMRMRFTVVASLLIIVVPFVIERLLFMLMPGMRV